MLRLNPFDNQGVRLLIGEADPWRGKTAERRKCRSLATGLL